MNYPPKKLITRLVEYAALFALSAFLIRLAVCYIMDVWWVLIILAAVSAAASIGYRIWKNKRNTQW